MSEEIFGDIKDYELVIFFYDANGEPWKDHYIVLPVDQFFQKPFLWSIEPTAIAGVCLKLRKK